MKRLLIICLLAGTGLALARADDATNLEAEKRQAIRELMQITGANQSSQQFATAFTQQMLSILRASNPQLPVKAEQIVTEEVLRLVRLEQENLQTRIQLIYAHHFSLAELQGLIAFNQSPVGVKANAVMPALMAESQQAGQAWSQDIVPRITVQILRRFSEEGIAVKHKAINP